MGTGLGLGGGVGRRLQDRSETQDASTSQCGIEEKQDLGKEVKINGVKRATSKERTSNYSAPQAFEIRFIKKMRVSSEIKISKMKFCKIISKE